MSENVAYNYGLESLLFHYRIANYRCRQQSDIDTRAQFLSLTKLNLDAVMYHRFGADIFSRERRGEHISQHLLGYYQKIKQKYS